MYKCDKTFFIDTIYKCQKYMDYLKISTFQELQRH